MKQMSMDDAKRSDAMILELAFYAESKGHQLDYKIKSQEEYIGLMKRVDKRFAEYKRLLIAKETSWDKLSGDILTKYAVDMRKFYSGAAPAHPTDSEPRIFGFAAQTQSKPKTKDNNENQAK